MQHYCVMASLSWLEASATALFSSSGSGKGPKLHRTAETTDAEVEGIQTAKPIEAERLIFKGRPAFDPLPYLEEPARSLYQDPLKFAKHPDEPFLPSKSEVLEKKYLDCWLLSMPLIVWLCLPPPSFEWNTELGCLH
ncbi:unnamed protein product [Durusdinium trenchii]|uniref:Uncharacterized protein n=1 Tax=Durusdinium trenchii TaxID=1381693 RepID=A0ABP0KGH0_9DINO